jgi:hypothetical protein
MANNWINRDSYFTYYFNQNCEQKVISYVLRRPEYINLANGGKNYTFYLNITNLNFFENNSHSMDYQQRVLFPTFFTIGYEFSPAFNCFQLAQPLRVLPIVNYRSDPNSNQIVTQIQFNDISKYVPFFIFGQHPINSYIYSCVFQFNYDLYYNYTGHHVSPNSSWIVTSTPLSRSLIGEEDIWFCNFEAISKNVNFLSTYFPYEYPPEPFLTITIKEEKGLLPEFVFNRYKFCYYPEVIEIRTNISRNINGVLINMDENNSYVLFSIIGYHLLYNNTLGSYNLCANDSFVNISVDKENNNLTTLVCLSNKIVFPPGKVNVYVFLFFAHVGEKISFFIFNYHLIF